MKKLLIAMFMLFPSYVMGEDALCLMPKGIQFEPLIKKGELIQPYFFRVGYQKEIFLVADGICLNLNNPSAPALAFPKAAKITDVCWAGNSGLLFSDNSSIYFRDEETDSVIRIIH